MSARLARWSAAPRHLRTRLRTYSTRAKTALHARTSPGVGREPWSMAPPQMYGWAPKRPRAPNLARSRIVTLSRTNIELYRYVRPDCRPRRFATCRLTAASAFGGTGTYVADHAHCIYAAPGMPRYELACLFSCTPCGAAGGDAIRSRSADGVPGADALAGAHRRSGQLDAWSQAGRGTAVA